MTDQARDVVTFPLWGGFATVAVTDADAMSIVLEVVEETLAQIDRAASNYRDDSDLTKLNNAAGRPVMVTELLAAAITVALESAAWTSGAVDPTVGGLTRDTTFAAKRTSYREVTFDKGMRIVTLPKDVQLDLGATGKAWAADLCANRAYAELSNRGFEGVGVMVSLAGDIAVAGPNDGWSILVTDDHRTDPNDVAAGQSVLITSGGLATSSTTTRQREDASGNRTAHIVDPTTWRPVESVWRTVTVVAPSCTAANAASTAAIVLGDRAIDFLNSNNLPARLVRHDGSVVTLNGWPTEEKDA